MASAAPPSLLEDNRRRKRRRPSGKRFECTQEGCGRVYSRAEHLQRHRLNHSPKEYYYCDFSGCTLSFVRKDLYLRHKSRHERLPEDQINNPAAPSPSQTQPSSHASSKFTGKDAEASMLSPPRRQVLKEVDHASIRSGQSDPLAHDDSNDVASFQHLRPVSGGFPSIASRLERAHPVENRSEEKLLDYGPRAGLLATVANEEPNFGISPSATDEFTAWLFNGQENFNSVSFFSDRGLDNSNSAEFSRLNSGNPQLATALRNVPSDFLRLPSPSVASYSPGFLFSRHASLSIERRQTLIDIMSRRFFEDGQDTSDTTSFARDQLLGGNLDTDDHALSLVSMERYLQSYWGNFHPQLPILHQPTFDPDNTHDYLVLAVMVLGAALLDRDTAPDPLQEQAAIFAGFVAYNLRWHVLMHPESSLPGNLWAIQTLLLLEMYEKLNATRALHERAHIYYPSTLNLMRRCSTLFGRHFVVATRAPSSANSPRLSHTSRRSSTNISGRPPPEAVALEPWWEQWIAREAMRRAALSAFLIDTTHAVMFGHSPTLVIHEIQMQLPCDNILWSSESPSEIGTVESCLYAHGVKQPSFLEALERILNGQEVRTNAFGRIILLAGLLSVSCQMHQRDLYGISLGGEGALGFQERWQPKLIRAFDWCMKDFDNRMDLVQGAFDWQKHWFRRESGRDHTVALLPLGTALYHLGHMTIHVSVPEICVFAGATRILGRIVSDSEKKKVRDKIQGWATSPDASNDIYHALKLIKFVLFSPSTGLGEPAGSPSMPSGSPDTGSLDVLYNVAYDPLLSRPWVLYFATLLAWAYGYALDGCLQPFPTRLQYPPATQSTQIAPPLFADPGPRTVPCSPSETTRLAVHQHGLPEMDPRGQGRPQSENEVPARARYHDLRTYLDTMLPPSVRSSEEFKLHLQRAENSLRGRRNKVLGMLGIVDEACAGSKWELLQEARQRLRSAAMLLRGGGPI